MYVQCNEYNTNRPRCKDCPHGKRHKPIGSCHSHWNKCSPNFTDINQSNKDMTINTKCQEMKSWENIKSSVHVQNAEIGIIVTNTTKKFFTSRNIIITTTINTIQTTIITALISYHCQASKWERITLISNDSNEIHIRVVNWYWNLHSNIAVIVWCLG